MLQTAFIQLSSRYDDRSGDWNLLIRVSTDFRYLGYSAVVLFIRNLVLLMRVNNCHLRC